MKVSRPHDRELTPEEIKDLEKLKELVRNALADGKLSEEEIETIRAAALLDGKITLEELHAVKDTIREVLGQAELEYDWD